jgi:hypothetical protein
MAFGFRKLVDTFLGATKPAQATPSFAANDPRWPDTGLHKTAVETVSPETVISEARKPSLSQRIRTVGANLQESVKKDWRWMAGNAAIAFAAKSLLIGSTGGIGAVIAGGIAISGLTSATVAYAKDRYRSLKTEAHNQQERGIIRPQRSFFKAAIEESSAFARHASGGAFWKKALTTSVWSAIGAGIGFGAHELLTEAPVSAPPVPAQTPDANSGVSGRISQGTIAPTPATEVPVPVPEPLTVMGHVREVLKNLPHVAPRVQELVDRIAEGNDQAAQARKDLAVLFYNQKAGLPMTDDVKQIGRDLFEEAAFYGNKQAARDLLWIEGKASPVYDPAVAAQKTAEKVAKAMADAAAPPAAPDIVPDTAPDSVATPDTVPPAPQPLETDIAKLAVQDPQVADALANQPDAKIAMACGTPIPKEIPPATPGEPLVLGNTNCAQAAEDMKPGDIVHLTDTTSGVSQTFQYAATDGAGTKTMKFGMDMLQQFVRDRLSFAGKAPAIQ